MKTNVRIDGKFLVKKSSKYYLSNIDNYSKWKDKSIISVSPNKRNDLNY